MMTQPPPVVPSYNPPTLAALMPASQPPRRKRNLGWLAWAIPALAVIAAAAVVASVLTAPRTGAQFVLRGGHSTTALALAWKQCTEAGQLADGDKTLVLDMAGEKYGTGSLSIQQVMCVLDALKVPAYVREEMAKTRALDGRQSQAWAEFEASWSYHPDNGLDIIIRQVR
jgi:hypothetical protein